MQYEAILQAPYFPKPLSVIATPSYIEYNEERFGEAIYLKGISSPVNCIFIKSIFLKNFDLSKVGLHEAAFLTHVKYEQTYSGIVLLGNCPAVKFLSQCNESSIIEF